MTREEAIEVLQQDIPCELDTDLIEALEIAIQALEQIDILKEAYNKGYKDGQEAIAFHLELCKDEGSIIEIPEGATNGDMIKALFPNAEYNEHERFVRIWSKNDRNDYVFELPLSFCNSPYRKEQK